MDTYALAGQMVTIVNTNRQILRVLLRSKPERASVVFFPRCGPVQSRTVRYGPEKQYQVPENNLFSGIGHAAPLSEEPNMVQARVHRCLSGPSWPGCPRRDEGGELMNPDLYSRVVVVVAKQLHGIQRKKICRYVILLLCDPGGCIKIMSTRVEIRSPSSYTNLAEFEMKSWCSTRSCSNSSNRCFSSSDMYTPVKLRKAHYLGLTFMLSRPQPLPRTLSSPLHNLGNHTRT